MTQSRSFESVNDSILRESAGNVFQEIKILKEKNEELEEEITELDDTLDRLADQSSGLLVIQDEIIKYQKLTGESPIFGSGIVISFNGNLTMPWIIDFTNELWTAGAQAISINDIRITNDSAGLDTLPKGQILLNSTILSPPYVFSAIGDSSTMIGILELPGGIFDRFHAAFPEVEVKTEIKAVIQMN